MNKTTEITLDTRWIRLAARQHNAESGKPVLALHGWLDNAASFQPLANHLPELNIVALDLAGHGLSQHRPPGQHYHFVDFVTDTLAAVDCLDWEQFTLLGHSMGAGIASLIAASFPHRIENLILIEGLGPWGDDPRKCASHLAEATHQILAPEKHPPRHYHSLDTMVRARMQAGGLSQHSAHLLVERNARLDGNGNRLWRTDPRLRFRSPIYITEEQTQAFLKGIAAPTLFIHDREREVPAHYHWEQRKGLIHNLQIAGLTGGHHLHMENPGPVAETIHRFLKASPESIS